MRLRGWDARTQQLRGLWEALGNEKAELPLSAGYALRMAYAFSRMKQQEEAMLRQNNPDPWFKRSRDNAQHELEVTVRDFIDDHVAHSDFAETTKFEVHSGPYPQPCHFCTWYPPPLSLDDPEVRALVGKETR